MFSGQIRSRHYFCFSSPKKPGGKSQLPASNVPIQSPHTDTDVRGGLFVSGRVLPIVGQLPLFRFRVLMPADLWQFSARVSALSSG